MHKDAYVIPFWLGSDVSGEDAPQRLFAEPHDVPADELRPNLADGALDYLEGLGVDDAGTVRDSASLLWLHVLAIGFTPLYLEENSHAIRSNWPRVPLPATAEALKSSAGLGFEVAQLLDLDTKLAGVDAPSVAPHLQPVAVISKVGRGVLNPKAGHLAVTAGYGTKQRTGAVMPGAGRVEERGRSDADSPGLSGAQRELLGEQLVDVYLNENACWRSVPAAAWDAKVGGFQVLRKWLSYREQRVLGRDLTTDEARAFTSITRRLSELALLGPRLDANYIAITESPHQEKLFAAA